MRRIPLSTLKSFQFRTMALNAASHNAPGVKTGPASGPPPSASAETTAALLQASKDDPTGHNEGGKDDGDKMAGAKEKSAKELEKERIKAEKMKKFEAKKAKSAASPVVPDVNNSKDKKAKKQEAAKEDQLPEYVEATPNGEKKGMITSKWDCSATNVLTCSSPTAS